MKVRFEWGLPADRREAEYDMENIPRVGDLVVIGMETQRVRQVFWCVETEDGKPLCPPNVLIRL